MTLLSNINPGFTPPVNYSLINTTGLDAETTVFNSVTIPAIVGYGTNDGVVGHNSAGTNGPVSNTDAIITNQQTAQPSHQVIRNTTADNHAILPSDSGQQLASTPSATALSSMGTLHVADTNGMTGSSGHMSIFASDNLWHTVTFTGSTSTTFTGCTYSGTPSATVINGSPICLSGDGPTHSMSYPYWFSTVVDPLCPKSF